MTTDDAIRTKITAAYNGIAFSEQTDKRILDGIETKLRSAERRKKWAKFSALVAAALILSSLAAVTAAVAFSRGASENHAEATQYKEERIISAPRSYYSADLRIIAAELSELVVIGEFKSNIDTDVADSMIIETSAEFEVKDVVRGEFDDSTIIIHYAGGTVSLYDYDQKKSGLCFDVNEDGLSDDEAKKIGITLCLENAAGFEPGIEYLICLGPGPSYTVMCDAFGTSEVHDGLVTNRFTGEIIPVDDLRG